MALFGYSKEKLNKAVNAATAETEQKLADKEKELESLQADKATTEDALKKTISDLEQQVIVRDQTISSMTTGHEEELERIRQKHINEITLVRKESAIQAQQMLEFIDARKESLEKKSDRELLLSAVMALEGYAGRLERVEKNMEYHDVIARMAEMKKEFSDRITETESALLEQLKSKKVFERIGQMQSDISKQIEDNTDDLTHKITSMNSLLTELMDSLKLPEKLKNLSDQIDDIYQKLSEKIQELENSVAAKIDEYDITGSLDSLQGTVNGIDETADDISESTDKIEEQLSELKSEIEKMDSLKMDLSEIKSSICDSWSSESISSKLDSIESSIQSLESSVDQARDAAERAANHDSY